MNGFKVTVCLALVLALTHLTTRAGIRFPTVDIKLTSATVANNQTVVRWQTAGDSGIVGFDLYRLMAGSQQWVKINDTPVVSSNSISGAAYAVVDSSATPYQAQWYRLVQTDQQGNVESLAPFPVTPSSRTGVQALLVQEPTNSTGSATPPSIRPMGVPSLAALDGSTFVKITTTNFGIQFVAAADLAALLGQPLATVQSAIAQGLFHLTVSGQPLTWLASPDASMLFFYAEAHKDNYSTNNIYWLTSQTNGVVRMENGQSPAPTSSANWYPAVQTYENDALYASSLPLGPEEDPWMWQQLVSGITGFNIGNNFARVDHLSQGTDRTAQLSVQLWGAVAATHYLQLTVNTNTVLGPWTWNGLAPTNFTVTIPSALLVNGSNKFAFLAVTNGTSTRSQWYLNNFTLSYPRTFTAVNGLIDFTANNNALITVDGFTSTNITLLDVGNPKQPVLVTNVFFDQPASTFRLSFVPAGPAAHYVAWQGGGAVPVQSLSLGRVAGFSAGSNASDYVIVSPPSLLAAATNLAIYRQQTGLKTIIAPLDQLYNEFAFGFPSPHAIQSLLATAWTNWNPRPHYLVLLGKGTYDFRDISQKHDNLTPPLIVSTQFGIFGSDSLMGDVNGDGLPEVAVGRLSGLTTNDLGVLISKIKTYESLTPPVSPQGLLIADAPDSAGNFTNDILQADAILTNKFTDNILFRTAVADAPTFHSMILTNWYLGVDFVDYSGHGAIAQFGTAGYLTYADLTNSSDYFLLNCARLPVVVAMTCVAGQYSVPGSSCLGEYLLQPAAGGAIAFLGPTGLSLSGEASEFNVRFTTLLRANALLGLGDIVRQAVADHVSQDLPSVPVWIYNLLGDPALHYNLKRELPPLQITAISARAMDWTGGLPPYQLEISTNLGGHSVWRSLGDSLIGTHAALTNDTSTGFIRVRGSQ